MSSICWGRADRDPDYDLMPVTSIECRPGLDLSIKGHDLYPNSFRLYALAQQTL